MAEIIVNETEDLEDFEFCHLETEDDDGTKLSEQEVKNQVWSYLLGTDDKSRLLLLEATKLAILATTYVMEVVKDGS